MNVVHLLRRCAGVIALTVTTLVASTPAQACVGEGCVMAGPRLASVNSTQGALLNAILGSLTGSTLTVSVADWNSIAGGNVSLIKTLNALQSQLGVASTATALNTPITLLQLTGALSTAASQAGNTAASVALGNLGVNLALPGTIKLGDLLTSDGIVGNTTVNALSLVTGALQLFNDKNVATTPAPITVSGVSLGQAGSLGQVQIQAQAIEPPVYVCGPAGSTFHTSALRVKLAMQLLTLNPSSTALNSIGLGSNVTLGNLEIYVEVAEASGVIASVNAVSNAMSAQVTPGLAALYLGHLDDSVFFNRNHAIVPATDLGFSTIGALTLLGQTVAIQAKAAAVGASPTPSTLSFSGTTLQTQTAAINASFAPDLVSSLFATLTLQLTPSLGGVTDGLVLPLLNGIVQGAVAPVLSSLTTGLVNPLLSTLGVRLGEVDVASGGEYLECAISGCVYADANHSGKQDAGETGTGATLYAKLVAASAPTVAAAVAVVDPVTGNYSFPAQLPAVYSVVLGTTNATNIVAPAGPAGWIGTETPTLARAVTLSTADLVAQNFGLFHGSSLAGSVFKDNGSGGGTANNGAQDGGETAIGGMQVSVTDASGATAVDSSRSDANGGYVLWIPSTSGVGPLKVWQAVDATVVAVSGKPGTTGGAFALAGATTAFTNVVGTVYTGVNFGDVPINKLDTDGQQAVAAGTTASYAHVFHAGSAGQLTLSVAALAAPPTGWSATLFQDANCNGTLDAGEAAITGPLAVVADQTVCVVVKVFVPQTAANETRATYVLTGGFAYANSTLTGQVTRQDITIVGASDGLLLVKSVDKPTAVSGDVITYTLTYTNQGAAAVNAVKIRDGTPPWTVLDGAACGTRGSGITGCSVTAQPAVGGTGSVEWTLAGALASGASGTVTFTVKVQ